MQSTISTFPPYLSLSVWLPILFGVLILAVGRDSRAGFTRVLSLVGAIVSFLPTIPLFTQFSNTAHGTPVRGKSRLDRTLQHPVLPGHRRPVACGSCR
jgi:NADH:ubiquinone oxidoreductase subunit 4 (subunit M)